MALTLVPTFTPSGYLEFTTALVSFTNPTWNGMSAADQRAMPTAVALPAGSSPATAIITNFGSEPARVLLTAAAATTTASGAAGSTTITVASATSVAVGQVAVAVGIASGTIVIAISGTAITLSSPTTAALSTTAINFVTAASASNAMGVNAGKSIALAYVSGFISAVCVNAGGRSVLNVAVGV